MLKFYFFTYKAKLGMSMISIKNTFDLRLSIRGEPFTVVDDNEYLLHHQTTTIFKNSMKSQKKELIKS